MSPRVLARRARGLGLGVVSSALAAVDSAARVLERRARGLGVEGRALGDINALLNRRENRGLSGAVE
jgi:hypothetical protein